VVLRIRAGHLIVRLLEVVIQIVIDEAFIEHEKAIILLKDLKSIPRWLQIHPETYLSPT